MTKDYSSIAKITCPEDTGVFERTRLFNLLDENLAKPVVWLSSPGGSGKTVLVSSYLKARNLPCIWYQVDEGDGDIASFFYYMGLAGKKAAPRRKKPLPLLAPEYMMGVSTFAKRYFEDLYSRLKSQQIIVLDNFQEVSGNRLFDDVIKNGLSVIPDGVRVIIVSREDPPKYMARLRASNKVGLLSWDDIQLTEEETSGIAGLRFNGEEINEKSFRLLHEKSGGWAAGLSLLLEGTETNPDTLQSIKSHTPETVFDYFASEVFEKSDESTKHFLLTTALLPRVTPDMAEEVSDNNNAAQILSGLNKRNFFTERRFDKGATYQYHPLFREFLLEQAHLFFTSQQFKGLQKKAAIILTNHGDLKKAIPLLIETQSWSELTDAIQQLGPTLIVRGCHMTLAGWLQIIPSSLFTNHPWLLYWLAASQIPADPDLSRENFIKALKYFAAKRIMDGIFLSWAGIADTIVNQLDHFKQFDEWIEKFDLLRKEYADCLPDNLVMFLSPRIFAAMVLRQPSHPDLKFWRDLVITLFEKGDDPSARILCGFYLIIYYLWVGDRTRLEQVIEIQKAIASEINASPLTRLTGFLAKAKFGWATGDHPSCDEAVEDGLSLAEQSGVHVWSCMLMVQSTTSALMSGNTRKAAPMFKQMATLLDAVRPMDRVYYYNNHAWLALLKGNKAKAYEYQSQALKLAISLGSPYFEAEARYGMFNVCYAQGDKDAARTHINEARRISEMFGSNTMAFQCDMADAQYLLDQNKTKEGLAALRSALERVREKGHIPFPWLLRDIMSRLCATALRYDIEPESACRIIRQHDLVPGISAPSPESWPWPIKIYTLKPFELIVNDQKVKFSGKTQKKPLDLLKSVIASGGRNVSIEPLMEHLWPDADGDLAHKSFNTALYRLRKLLGIEEAITLNDSRLSLNDQICWLDMWAFEELAKAADQIWEQVPGKMKEAEDISKNIIEMHTSRFLENDSEYYSVVTTRERLQNMFLKNVHRVGGYWESQDKLWDAIKYYNNGLEIDKLDEKLYQKAMNCYMKLNEKSEALHTYVKCKNALEDELAIDPSSATESLKNEIMKM